MFPELHLKECHKLFQYLKLGISNLSDIVLC